MPVNNPCHHHHPFPLLLLLLLLTLPLFSSVLAVNLQGEALLSWKQTLNGSIEALSNWEPVDQTPCRWFGVSCNSNNEVAELNLRYVDLHGTVPSNFSSLIPTLTKLALVGTNLTGSIPREIGMLHELKSLDLSDNALNGEIPSEICFLPKLQELYLNSNRLEGSIPIEIGNLTSLGWLILYDNQLSGAIPSTIGNLKNLAVIRAGGNKNLEGPLPLELGNCASLVLLGLAETSISGSLPSTIGNLKKLQTIAIYTALLSGEIPPEIGNCTNLQSIYLYENSLSGSIPSHLGNLKNLQNLFLWQNALVGTIPHELGKCTNLVVVDISMNSLTGSIPESLGNLTNLQELQLSMNQLSGPIPSSVGACSSLTHIELDNNQLSGAIPSELGQLGNLSLLFLWQNKLEGNIPPSLADCKNLEGIDFSSNSLTGLIPKGIFQLQKLNKLLLLSNNLSGSISPEIGQCSSLIRFRANNNKLTGEIPRTVGGLKNLNFFDVGSNRLTGVIPEEISGCHNLTFLDLHSNSISGALPVSLSSLFSLQFVDVSDNQIEGELSPSIGSLSSLTKLVLGTNKFNGSIPSQIGSCSKLQLIDLSSNLFSGQIPSSIGKIQGLEIALNLSWNQLSGDIPPAFSSLSKLGVLDLSHNELSGDLHLLAGLQNLVVLNISNNNFSGRVPNTALFSNLPAAMLAGNPGLCAVGGRQCAAGKSVRRTARAKVAMVVLLSVASALFLAALYIIIGGARQLRGADGNKDDVECPEDDVEMGPPWEVTLYQKLDLSIADVTRCLVADNVIGRGRSGAVYQVSLLSGHTIAVKKFRSLDKTSAVFFSSEITTLARIRHRNIVRLLGWAANRRTKLLFYDYLPNGTLDTLLHEGGATSPVVDWETRFKIALGVAEGLAYLHHDCVPPIVHRDVKVHNILLGDRYEACLADFGLARLVEDQGGLLSSPQFAGSYGYMAPEHACMLKISEKSDVFSYGVVLLEIITGKKPVDPSFPDGQQHVIQWVREHLKSQRDPVEIIDPKLQGHPDMQIQEMLQALGIALLCTSNRADDRPTMKDVAVLLKEIKHEAPNGSEAQKPTSNISKQEENPSLSTSSSMSPAQLLLPQGSFNCSLNYSSCSIGYPSENR